MTPEQTVRRNEIQALLEGDRPRVFATWIIEHMTDEEAAAFDTANDEHEQRQLIGECLDRLKHPQATYYMIEPVRHQQVDTGPPPPQSVGDDLIDPEEPEAPRIDSE